MSRKENRSRIPASSAHEDPESYPDMETMRMAFPTANSFYSYYDQRLGNYHKQVLELSNLFERYKEKVQLDSTWEERIRKRDEDARNLELSLAESKRCNLEERNNYIRLVAENEQLKLDNDDLRVKFEVLLVLTNKKEEDVTRYLERNPGASEKAMKMNKIREEIDSYTNAPKLKSVTSPVILNKKIKILENELEQLNLVYRSKNYLVSNSLKSIKEESQIKLEELLLRNRNLSKRLTESDALLHTALAENLKQQNAGLLREREWTDERMLFTDSLFEVRQQCRNRNREDGTFYSTQEENDESQLRKFERTIAQLKNQVEEKTNLLYKHEIRLFELKCQEQDMNNELEHFKHLAGKSTKQLKEHNTLLQKRYDVAEARRKTEAMGYREELKAVSKLLATLEKKVNETKIHQLRSCATNEVLQAVVKISSLSARESKSGRSSKKSPLPRRPITAPDESNTNRRTKECCPPPPPQTENPITQEELAWLVSEAKDKVKLFEQLLNKK